ncbi:MAG TPA: phosphatidate cytidylyltransferase [Planctomycetaceae bacterium]|nr:phosphatidate cytidylyltransferase [Planctomycetaceae bacterium]
MLRSRLIASSILIPLLIALFWLDHRTGRFAPYLLALCLFVAGRGTWELVRLLGRCGLKASPAWTIGSAMLLVAAGWRYPPWAGSGATLPSTALLGAFVAVLLTLLVKGVLTFRADGEDVRRLAAEVFAVTYVGLLISVTAQLRWIAGTSAGYLALGSLVIAVKMGDTGAYMLGRLFGRKKLAPRLSPAKTWMGAFGAVLFAGLGAVCWLRLAPPLFDRHWPPVAWHWAALYGALLGLAGLIGDLCESLIKRGADEKDSAPLLPGLGGLLDMLDSILLAGPVALALWWLFPLAPPA